MLVRRSLSKKRSVTRGRNSRDLRVSSYIRVCTCTYVRNLCCRRLAYYDVCGESWSHARPFSPNSAMDYSLSVFRVLCPFVKTFFLFTLPCLTEGEGRVKSLMRWWEKKTCAEILMNSHAYLRLLRFICDLYTSFKGYVSRWHCPARRTAVLSCLSAAIGADGGVGPWLLLLVRAAVLRVLSLRQHPQTTQREGRLARLVQPNQSGGHERHQQ